MNPIELEKTPLRSKASLRAYFRFENVFTDEIGNFTGTLDIQSNYQWSTSYGKFGAGLSHNGAGTGKMHMPHLNSYIVPTSDFTIMGWYQAKGDASYGGTYHPFLNNGGWGDSTKNWIFGCGTPSGANVNGMFVGTYSGTSDYYTFGSTLALSEWHHYCWVNRYSTDPTNPNYVYLDGVYQGKRGRNHSWTYDTSTWYTRIMEAGYDTGGGDPYFKANGYLDELAVFSEALTDAEIYAYVSGNWGSPRIFTMM